MRMGRLARGPDGWHVIVYARLEPATGERVRVRHRDGRVTEAVVRRVVKRPHNGQNQRRWHCHVEEQNDGHQRTV